MNQLRDGYIFREALIVPSAIADSFDSIGGLQEAKDALRRGVAAPAEALRDAPMNDAVDALKRAMIEDALRETGNKTGAARKLGMPRQSLQKMMKRLNLK